MKETELQKDFKAFLNVGTQLQESLRSPKKKVKKRNYYKKTMKKIQRGLI